MADINLPWKEKYRPNTLSDILIQSDLKKKIEDCIKNGPEKLPDYLFIGPAGCGKTSLSWVIGKELNMPTLYINCGDESGIEMIRTKLKGFCSSASIDGDLKLVILDEADGLSGAALTSLKGLLEYFSKTSRFIFTTNNPESIPSPIKSRLKEVYFKPVDIKEVHKLIYSILRKENIKVDKDNADKLKKLIDQNYPDIRKTINWLQTFCIAGDLDIQFDELVSEDIFEKYIENVKKRKMSLIRELLRNNRVNYLAMIKKVYNEFASEGKFLPDLAESARVEGIILCSEYSYRTNFIIDGEINFADFSAQLMMLLKKYEKKDG